MKKIGYFTIVILVIASLFGCSLESASVIIYPSKTEVSKELSLYKNWEFSSCGLDGTIELFSSAQKNMDGSMPWDDSNTFFIQVILDDEKYVIFDEEVVQLGIPTVNVFFDDEDALHLILIDARTAQYNIYDFIYDYSNKYFVKRTITENSPINYLGGI